MHPLPMIYDDMKGQFKVTWIISQTECHQANSASYPQWGKKWVVATATGWRPRVADWGDGVSASCTMGTKQLCISAGNGWPHNVLWHHWLMSISCHFWDCKALLVASLTHVSGAITSVQTFTFTRPLSLQKISHLDESSQIYIWINDTDGVVSYAIRMAHKQISQLTEQLPVTYGDPRILHCLTCVNGCHWQRAGNHTWTTST